MRLLPERLRSEPFAGVPAKPMVLFPRSIEPDTWSDPPDEAPRASSELTLPMAAGLVIRKTPAETPMKPVIVEFPLMMSVPWPTLSKPLMPARGAPMVCVP